MLLRQNLLVEPPNHAVGRSRSGLSTKIHHVVDCADGGAEATVEICCAEGHHVPPDELAVRVANR